MGGGEDGRMDGQQSEETADQVRERKREGLMDHDRRVERGERQGGNKCSKFELQEAKPRCIATLN